MPAFFYYFIGDTVRRGSGDVTHSEVEPGQDVSGFNDVPVFDDVDPSGVVLSEVFSTGVAVSALPAYNGSADVTLTEARCAQSIRGSNSDPSNTGRTSSPVGAVVGKVVCAGAGLVSPGPGSADIVLSAAVCRGIGTVGTLSSGVADVTLSAAVCVGVGEASTAQFVGTASVILSEAFSTSVADAQPQMLDASGNVTLSEVQDGGIGLQKVFVQNDDAYRRIAVDQQQGGSLYPFLAADGVLTKLIGDLYFRYGDDACIWRPPFRIAWLAGFGAAAVPRPDGVPTPTHFFDVGIVDADGREVFDSTQATFFNVLPWGPRFFVSEWQLGEKLLRVTSFAQGDDESVWNTLPVFLAPEESSLQLRTLDRRVRKLRTLRVAGDSALPAGPVLLKAGYNIRLDVQPQTEQEGRRRITNVVVNGIPGAGEGRYPGCLDENPPLRKLHNVGPDEHGNVILRGDSCWRVRIPTIANFDSEGNPYTTIEENALQLDQYCLACCQCEEFLKTYRALSALWTKAGNLFRRAQEARDQLQANIDRWNAQKACREANPIQVAFQVQCGGVVTVAVSWQNYSAECVYGISIHLEVSTNATGGDPVLLCGDQPPAGTWPSYAAAIPVVRPHGLATVKASYKTPFVENEQYMLFDVVVKKNNQTIATTSASTGLLK